MKFAAPTINPEPLAEDPGTTIAPTRAGDRRGFVHEWLVAGMLLILDLATWAAIYAIATMARGDISFGTSFQFFLLEAVQLVVIVGALFVIGGYNRHTEMRGLSYATEHVLAMLVAGVACAMVVYSAAAFDQAMRPSRAVLLLSFVAFLPISLLYRREIRGAFAASTAGRVFLVVGCGEMAVEFYRAYKESINRERLEFVDPERKRVGEHIAGPGSPIIEGDLTTKLERLGHTYSGVILAERMKNFGPALLERLVRTQFQRVRVYTMESFHEAHWRHVPVHSIDPYWPLQTGFQLARNSPYHYAKRLFDVGLATLLLVICAPLLGAVALAIWLEDRGAVIFRQPRVGRDNEVFTVFKFRTMKAKRGMRSAAVTQAEPRPGFQCGMENQGAAVSSPPSAFPLPENQSQITINPSSASDAEDDIYTRPNDPRITRMGRWLRNLRMDELPQLWNVLRGEMSLIGPRAEWTRCAERYEKVIPFYHFRHLVKPGITGWAQVNYGYGESDEDAIEKLKYDLYYIRNYSLKLDLMIVFKTAFTVLFGKGR